MKPIRPIAWRRRRAASAYLLAFDQFNARTSAVYQRLASLSANHNNPGKQG